MRHRCAHAFLPVWLLSAVALVGAPAVAIEVELRVLAVEETASLVPDHVYHLVEDPVVAADGRVVFASRLRLVGGPSDSLARTLFETGEGDELEVVLPARGLLPGFPPGWVYVTVALFDARPGRTLVEAFLSPPPLGSDSFPAILELGPTGDDVALVQLPSLPELPLVPIGAFLESAFSDAGPVPFLARFGSGGGSAPQGIGGADASGTVRLLAYEGRQAPGGAVLDTIHRPVSFDHRGHVAFRGTQRLGPRDAIWGPDASGDLALRVEEGEPAPGSAAGRQLADLGSDLYLTELGDLYFQATCDDGSVGIWQQASDGTTVPRVEACGAPLPGAPLIDSLAGFGASDPGTLLFWGTVQAFPNGPRFIWRSDSPGHVERLAQSNHPIPGRPQLAYAKGNDAVSNGRGDFLLAVTAVGDSFINFNSALLFVPRGGFPIPLVARGDEIEVAPGDVRTVFEARYGPNPMNDDGRFALRLRFQDGTSGIAVVDVDVDVDTDGDGLEDVRDNCPEIANPDQADTDRDFVGDACNDADDRDGDEIRDDFDLCPDVPDPHQTDTDRDGIGDACNDADDRDGDEIRDDLDNCPDTPSLDLTDGDGDGLGDVCDPFPDEVDHEKGQLGADLLVCTESLAECTAQPRFEDADQDGEEDSTDACPDTEPGAGVDDAGCSIEQFCAARSPVSGLAGLFVCLTSDWRGDEPVAWAPGDCTPQWSWSWRVECEVGASPGGSPR